MKKLIALLTLFAAFTLPVTAAFAEDIHQHEQGAQAMPEETAKPDAKVDDHMAMMQESMKKMQAQMEKIHHSQNSKERLRLLQEHGQSMRGSIKVMREMMGSHMMGSHMMGGGCMMGNQMKDGQATGGCTGCMQGGCMMGGQMKGGQMPGGCPMGGGSGNQMMKCPMMEMMGKHADMMLMMMEQMMEHNEAAMATRK